MPSRLCNPSEVLSMHHVKNPTNNAQTAKKASGTVKQVSRFSQDIVTRLHIENAVMFLDEHQEEYVH
jgi:iron-sulfur cluster repair protein YtfE (RIC family)